MGAGRSCRLSTCLEYYEGGEGTPPRASAWQIEGSGGWTREMDRRGIGRGNSESIFARIVTVSHPVAIPVHACKSVASL